MLTDPYSCEVIRRVRIYGTFSIGKDIKGVSVYFRKEENGHTCSVSSLGFSFPISKFIHHSSAQVVLCKKLFGPEIDVSDAPVQKYKLSGVCKHPLTVQINL